MICPSCHGNGFIANEYRRFADGGAYIEAFESDCVKCDSQGEVNVAENLEPRETQRELGE